MMSKDQLIKNQISLHELKVTHTVLAGVIENYEHDEHHIGDDHSMALEVLRRARNLIAVEAIHIHGRALTRKFIDE